MENGSGQAVEAVIQLPRKLRQEDCKFKACLGNFLEPLSQNEKKLGEGEYSLVAEHMPSSICGSLDLSPSTAKQISGWTDVCVCACVHVCRSARL